MKHKLSKQILSMLLALVMVIGLIPVSTLTVFAAEPIIIHEIKTKMAAENVPRAGMEVDYFIPNVPDGEPYERPWQGVSWYDEYGTMISPNENSWFDIGYEFEAGRSYYADYKFWADYGYAFADNPTITFIGPDPSLYTYEIIERSEEDRSVTVRYTFTIPGVRDYPDINKVSLIYYGTVAEGSAKPLASEPAYNNCTLTREEWNAGTWGSECVWTLDEEDAKRFKAGETYVHMIELTAHDGYHFSENLLVQKGRQGHEEIGEVTLSKNRTVATITYTYPIATIEYLDVVNMEPKAGAENFYLVRNGANMSGGLPFTTTYHYADEPYEENLKIGYSWTDVETGEKLYRGIEDMVFELGKKYRLHFYIDIKDEYYEIVRFGEHTKLNLNYYVPGRSDYVEVETYAGDGSSGMSVYITYTVQPKPGEGKSASNPVICYNYNEFKYAMENENIRYVALANVNKTLPVGEVGLVTAIKVKGIKNLQLLGDATFTAPAMTETTYAALLHTTDNTTLNISGAGSLTFKAVANSSFNAVIYNQGGSVNISEGTLIGSYKTAVYGSAIWQEYGELRIKDGRFFADNASAPLSLPTPMSAVIVYGGQAWIEGGTFRMRNWVTTIDPPYGLQIGKNATVDLSGGTFHGILLPPSTQSHTYRMSDYVESGYVMTIDGVKSTPSIYPTISGSIVEVYKEISKIDIHVNSPAAGEVPATTPAEVYLVPDGCTVKSIQWYENGELWSDIDIGSARFEAGKTYKVEIALVTDAGVKFANPLSSATINSKKATVTALEDDRETSIVLTVNLGTCPNVVPDVALSVYAPKEGNTVSFAIGDNSSAYQAMGAANSASEYREWMVSDTGAAGTYQLMKEGDKFVSGKYYKIVVWVQTGNHYEFPVHDDNGRIMHNVSATVNGYYATVRKAYEQDPSRVIEVEYDFGMCNDDTVEQIAVVDVTAPVAGEKPNYTYNILGSGYQMNTALNDYKDIYWTNPPEQWYFIKNGIGWWDVTEENWVYEHETFIPGHEYRAYVYLITEDGYEFAYTAKYYENAVTATMNGNTAEVEIWEGYWARQRRVKYTFTCEQKEVATIILYDLDAPQAGKTPDTTITPAYPEFYEVKSVRWLDEEDGVVNEFEQGRLYTAEITIAAKDYDGTDGCIFADVLTAYIDGTRVEGWSNSVTKNNDNTVTIRYGFRKGASAPEITPYLFITQPQGGTLTVGQAHNTTWQTTFIPTKTEIQYWDGEAWDQWDVQTPENAVDDYDFQYDEAAIYQFRVITYVNDIVVATSNTFTIKWQSSHTCSNPQKQNGKSATCTVNGWKDYYKCSCGKLYTNSNCTTEIINLESWKIGDGKIAAAHKYGTLKPEQKAVHTKTELKGAVAEHYFCDECDIYFDSNKKQTTLEALTGKTPTHSGGTATCKAKAKCSVCGVSYGAVNKNNHSALTTLKAVSATCTKTGLTEGKKCTDCGVVTVAQKTVAKKAHTYKSVTTKATTSKNGSVVKKCSVCGSQASKTTIYYAKKIKLSTTKYTYNGKARKPSVTVYDYKGNKISSSNYTVSYASGCKYVGKYKVTIKFKSKYSGTLTTYFTIIPKESKVSSLTAAKKSLKVKLSKVSSQASGYEIQYSTSKKFTKSTTKTKKVTSYKTTSVTLKSLKAKKTYYVRVRTYKTVNGTKYYSGWSTVKSKKTK